MNYASYALLAGHWLPWMILVWIWAAVFLVNMLVIEASLARYPRWGSYRRTGCFCLAFDSLPGWHTSCNILSGD